MAQLKEIAADEGVGYQTVLKRLLSEKLAEHPSRAHLPSWPQSTDEPPKPPEGASEAQQSGDSPGLSDEDMGDIFEGIDE